jgi:acyl-CoA dehydrogenase
MDATPLTRSAPDPTPIEAFLEARHLATASRLGDLMEELGGLPATPDDGAARTQAREILGLLGRDGWYAPIEAQDFRSCCLVREALGAASPLADAVYALQALGSIPLILGGDTAHRDRWVGPAMKGEAMAAFAMTEPEAGSDVASLSTTAVRDGGDYVLNGRKTFISNAGIADFYSVFATMDPELGTRGITCFVIPADTPGLEFAGAQVMSAPHPLGELSLTDCRVPAANVGSRWEWPPWTGCGPPWAPPRAAWHPAPSRRRWHTP